MSRRAFFKTAAGMAAAFVAMNETYGQLYDASRAEAAIPEMAGERAKALSNQFVMDMHTHFLRDDTRITNFVRQREAVGKAGWNPALQGKPQTIEDLKFANYFKEVFLDSDTKVACISGSASEEPRDWFLTNQMKFDARAKVNKEAGTKRMFSHAIMTPGWPGWLDKVDEEMEKLKPDSWKGYTIGDNTNKNLSKHPYRLDNEKLMYPFYERLVKWSKDHPGVVNVCIHKGLFPPSVEQQFPHLVGYCHVGDVGKAAKDWPQLNFIIYHSAYRWAGGGTAEQAWEQLNRTGRIEWVNDLAEIPGAIRREKRLRRLGPDLRPEHDGRSAHLRVHDGHVGQRARRRSCRVGVGRCLDRLSPVADRSVAPFGDPRGDAKKTRLQAARPGGWPGQARDLRREQRAAVSFQPAAALGAGERSLRATKRGLRKKRRRAQQSHLRLHLQTEGLSFRL